METYIKMRGSTAKTATSTAILLATVSACVPAIAGTWQKTAAGSYSWVDAANWDTAFPNAAGAVANLNINMAGSQTVNLDQAISIGTLNVGDTGGSPGAALTIASGTGGNPLVFQSATAGGAAAINFSPVTVPSGVALNLSAGVTLGGTSPLTLNLGGGLTYGVTAGAVNLGASTFTVAGPSQPNFFTPPVASFDPGVLTGSGALIQNGGAVSLNRDIPGFSGSIIVNDGQFKVDQYNMAAVSQYAVGGAWDKRDYAVSTSGRYPLGGWFLLGDTGWPAVTTLPDRLNHNARIVLNSGGYLEYRGQLVSSSLSGQALVEQVKQLVINPGLSQLRMLNGATDGSDRLSSTTLLMNDPTNALARAQGGTMLIGGDDSNSAKGFQYAMGVREKLKFNSGITSHLKGGGGTPGTSSVSIIPWMIDGTIYHPGQGGLVTYDSTNGIRCLDPNTEYYSGTVYGCSPTYNVRGSDLNLGSNHTQTINSYVTDSYENTDIGPGSTLTVTSGCIEFRYNSPGSIGNGSAANAGTINFGLAEGVIWSAFTAQGSPNVVGSVLTGSGGLTISGTNVLLLKGANTYTGKTTVGCGTLQVGDGTVVAAKLGVGDIEVCPGATLRIAADVANALANTAVVTLDNNGSPFYGTMDLASGINETVGGLVLGGIAQPAGTYGSSSSTATYRLDAYFSGPGVLTVTPVPEPASLTLFVLCVLPLGRWCRGHQA